MFKKKEKSGEAGSPRIKKQASRKFRFSSGNIMMVLVSLALSICLFAGMIFLENFLSDQVVYTDVVVAAKEVKQGTKITKSNVSEYFEKRSVDVLSVPENAVQDGEQLIGQMAHSDLEKGEMVLEKDLVAIDDYESAFEDPVEITISVSDLAAANAGRIRAGDIIDLTFIIGADEGDNVTTSSTADSSSTVISSNANQSSFNRDATVYVLQNLYVTAAYDGSGLEIPQEDAETGATMFRLLLERQDAIIINDAIGSGSNLKIAKVLHTDDIFNRTVDKNESSEESEESKDPEWINEFFDTEQNTDLNPVEETNGQ